MPVTSDIVQSYRRPRSVMRRLLDAGQREDRAIAILVGGCLMFFVASWPRLARQAETTGEDLAQLLAYALFGTIFILPLLCYGIAALSHLIARLIGGKGSWYGARLAFFWSLLATSPVLLLWGLTLGFIGPSLQSQIVSLLWFGVFILFWSINLREAERG
ncbi:MAG: YIP1 family protein [Pseudomonadota bacterium]